MAAIPTSAILAQPLRRNNFDHLQGAFCKEKVLFRLIHFWEAHNHTRGNTLIGLELLLIDEKGATIQAFILANRISAFEKLLKPHSVYTLKKFIISPCKKVFKVSDHNYGICFNNQTELEEVTNEGTDIDFEKFRIRPFNDFAEIVNKNGDLLGGCGRLYHCHLWEIEG